MADQKFTRCPGCATVFRVTPEQLALREGQVRCGHCRAVFDANSHLVSVEVRAPEDEEPDELLSGRPTVTLRDSRALQSVVEPGSPGSAAAGVLAGIDAGTAASIPVQTSAAAVPEDGDTTPPASTAIATEESAGGPAIASDPTLPGVADAELDATAAEPEVAEAGPEVVEPEPEVAEAGPEVVEPEPEVAGAKPDVDTDHGAAQAPVDLAELEAARAALRRRAPRPRSGNVFYAFAILLLVVGLGAQALLEFHDSLAARVPRLAPVLASACRWLSCTIRPMRNNSALSIEGSDLQADPAHEGLLILTATVRNRSAYALAYPYLELTLTDASDQTVVRRAFAPSEYLPGNVDRDAGIAGNHEQLVRLFIDASTSNQAGYRLYLFYP